MPNGTYGGVRGQLILPYSILKLRRDCINFVILPIHIYLSDFSIVVFLLGICEKILII
jgi:hypothetical protein